MITPQSDAIPPCFPLIKALADEGSVLIVGNLAESEDLSLLNHMFVEKHLRQILFWNTPDIQNGEKQHSIKPYCRHHLWTRSPHALSWDQIGHFDVIWLLPETIDSFDLSSMQNVFRTVCQLSHFTVLSIPRETLKKWMKQAGFKQGPQPKQLESFFSKHLPGVFWGQSPEGNHSGKNQLEENQPDKNQDMMHIIATHKQHTPAELETFQQELNELVEFETALKHFKAQQELREKALQQQQSEASRLEKATWVAKLLAKKALPL
jgi:hypothetical protein